jgi:hypothetical protein
MNTASVSQLEVGELAASGVGSEGGEAVAVDVGEPQLRAGVRSFFADDDPHPGKLAGRRAWARPAALNATA